MDNVDEIRKYFHFEDQLHPYGYENKEQPAKEEQQSQQKHNTTAEKIQCCRHPIADNQCCWLTYFYMRNTFKGLLKMFFWEISRLSQYTHFNYRLDKDAEFLLGAVQSGIVASSYQGDKLIDDADGDGNYNQWDHNSLLQHFTFVSKQRSKYLRPFVGDYDLYSSSLGMFQSKRTQSFHKCNNRIVVVGRGASLLYFLNYLIHR